MLVSVGCVFSLTDLEQQSKKKTETNKYSLEMNKQNLEYKIL